MKRAKSGAGHVRLVEAPSHQFHPGMVAGGSCQTVVAGEQHGVQRFGQGYR